MSEMAATTDALDPATLTLFRRQGAAIIAAERGMTPAGRVKLAGIARQLGIGDDQIEAAIRSLGESDAPPIPTNPAVEKFRRRLTKDFAGKSRTIISPTIEGHIVAAAERKYGLDAATVREVVGQVAAELGMRRISASQALDSLAQQIDDTAGDATWLAKEAWDRLRIAGGKWGIELEVIDELIEEKLAANKSERSRRRLFTTATLAGTGLALALVVVILGVVAFFRSRRIAEGTDAGPAVTVAPATPAPSAPRKDPAWWDVDHAIAIANLRKFEPAAPIGPALPSESASTRAGAYRRLAELSLTSAPPAGFRQAIAAVLGGSFALEADDAAAREVLASLAALVPSADSSLPKGRGEYESAYWAGSTLAGLSTRPGLTDSRRQMWQSTAGLLGLSTSSSLTPLDRERDARIAVTRRLFAQLTAAAPREPAQAAVLFGYLSELAVDLSDEEFHRWEATYLASALPAAGQDWPQYKDGIIRAVSSPDPLNALKMLDAYQRVTDPELKQQLAEWLIARTGVQPKSWQPIDVVTAVRKGLGVASSAGTTANDRWQLLRQRADEALARSVPGATNHEQLLSQTIELAHLTTLAIALAQGDAGHAVFDATIGETPELNPVALPADVDPAAARPTRRPVAIPGSRDDRTLERWITLVGNHDRQQQVQRESNLRGLAQMADKIPDLSPQEAAKVTEYLLAEKNEAELKVVIEALSAMRVWKRLPLAIADGLARSPLSPEQKRLIVGALVEAGDMPETSDVDALRLAILHSVLSELSADPAPAAATDAAGQTFERAAELLAETYRARARLFSVSPSSLAAAESPAQALSLSIDPIAGSLRVVADEDDVQFLKQFEHQANAWGHVCEGDLQRTAAINRTLLDLASRRTARMRPTQSAAVNQIAVELAAAERSAPSVLVQLRSQEAAALQLWMLHAPQL
jgi:hypothetical protein